MSWTSPTIRPHGVARCIEVSQIDLLDEPPPGAEIVVANVPQAVHEAIAAALTVVPRIALGARPLQLIMRFGRYP